MYYGARYYDPALGRFIQPDTIVPNLFNPQSLNRYSYVRNNPINLTDPTGHEEGNCEQQNSDCDTYHHAKGLCWNQKQEAYTKSCPAFVETEEDLEQLTNEHPDLLANPYLRLLFTISEQTRRLGILDNIGVSLLNSGVSELGVLVSLTNLDAWLTGNNATSFVDDLSLLFLGFHPWDSIQCGLGVFCTRSYASNVQRLLTKGGTGFHPSYQDPPAAVAAGVGTQVFHLWEFVALGYQYNHYASTGGDAFHEFTEWVRGGPGVSWQDYHLSQVGAYVGHWLRDGGFYVGDKYTSFSPMDVSPALNHFLTQPALQ